MAPGVYILASTVLSLAVVTVTGAEETVVVMTPEDQKRLLSAARMECFLRTKQNRTSNDTGVPMCDIAWDNVLCWDPTPAGTLAVQPCPKYIHDFNTQKFATRMCTKNGTWFFNPFFNRTWTNYTNCFNKPQNYSELAAAGDSLRLLYNVGYGVSLCSLAVAMVIMLCCRGLKSKSNTLHINLFAAFIMRAMLSFLKDLLFVQHVGFEKDVTRGPDGTLIFIEEGTHWECRLLITLFTYSISASQTWIFMEGLYLHMLIYRTLHTERKGVRVYVIVGWLLPLSFLLPWVTVRIVSDNTYCWNIATKPSFAWIYRGPMMATVVINFIFFLDILRVLCSRVRAAQRHLGRTKYRRLAKFILVLIPLFGVLYIVMYVAFPGGQGDHLNITYLYIEMTYNSFQGFILALLFCFLNEEVHAELKRVWYRRKCRRGDSIALTKSMALSSFKRISYYSRGQDSSGSQARKVSTATINDNVKRDDIFTKLKTRAIKLFQKEDVPLGDVFQEERPCCNDLFSKQVSSSWPESNGGVPLSVHDDDACMNFRHADDLNFDNLINDEDVDQNDDTFDKTHRDSNDNDKSQDGEPLRISSV